MSNEELVNYRVSRAKETYEEAVLLSKENHWNASVNRLYYACFYMVNALLIKNGLSYSSHNGVKAELHKTFVKTGKISIESGKLYNKLFNMRQEGDYIDFKRFEKEEIAPYLAETHDFISEIEKLLY